MDKENKNLNRIKVVLAEKNIQNKWLAERIGRDQATISKWVTNSAQPNLETLIKIAQVRFRFNRFFKIFRVWPLLFPVISLLQVAIFSTIPLLYPSQIGLRFLRLSAPGAARQPRRLIP